MTNCRAPACRSCSARNDEYEAYVDAMVRSGAHAGREPSVVVDPAVAEISDAGAARAGLLHAHRRHDRDRGALPRAGALFCMLIRSTMPGSTTSTGRLRSRTNGGPSATASQGTFVTRSGAVTVGRHARPGPDHDRGRRRRAGLRRAAGALPRPSSSRALRPTPSYGYLLKVNTKVPILLCIR